MKKTIEKKTTKVEKYLYLIGTIIWGIIFLEEVINLNNITEQIEITKHAGILITSTIILVFFAEKM